MHALVLVLELGNSFVLCQVVAEEGSAMARQASYTYFRPSEFIL